jgi:hypothetical protein
MLASVHRRPGPFMACANEIRVTAGERWRREQWLSVDQ